MRCRSSRPAVFRGSEGRVVAAAALRRDYRRGFRLDHRFAETGRATVRVAEKQWVGAAPLPCGRRGPEEAGGSPGLERGPLARSRNCHAHAGRRSTSNGRRVGRSHPCFREAAPGAVPGWLVVRNGSHLHRPGILRGGPASPPRKGIDAFFATHRGHGHYLAYGGPEDALLAELMGREGALCLGRGGTQNLCFGRFFSGGIQGGMCADRDRLCLGDEAPR